MLEAVDTKKVYCAALAGDYIHLTLLLGPLRVRIEQRLYDCLPRLVHRCVVQRQVTTLRKAAATA